MAHQRRNRNRNALETLKEKPLNLLHPYRSSFTHLTNFIPRHEREMNKQIISTDSTDQEVKFYMFKASPFIDPPIQYADGDKHFRSDFVHFQQTKFIDDYSDIREQRSKSIKRPVPRRPSSNHFFTRPAKGERLPLSTVDPSLIPSRQNTAWRKLRANITESYYNRIQEFQRDRQQQPCRIMMSPLVRQVRSSSSTVSPNQESLGETSVKTVSKSVEELRPMSPLQWPSLLSCDVLSSYLPALMDNRPNLTEVFLIQPSVRIEELCLLIRQLLEKDSLAEEQTTSLQRNLVNQLGILLTYFAMMEQQQQKNSPSFIPKSTAERSTSTDFDVLSEAKPRLVTVETQKEFEDHSESLSFVMDELDRERLRPSPPSRSISVTLKLPGAHQLLHAHSDTFLNYRSCRSSYHQFCSSSETAMLVRRRDRFSIWSKQTNGVGEANRRISKRFQYLIELQSSNTCLEGSTEFTPDFLLTAMTNSKFDDDDHTEQFGIETDQQRYLLDTISSRVDDPQDKLETLTFDSIDGESDDSLDLLPIKSTENEEHLSSFSPSADRVENLSQWQLPGSARRTNSCDDFTAKHQSQFHLKHRNTSFHSHSLSSYRSMIGQRVRIKSMHNQNNNFYDDEQSTSFNSDTEDRSRAEGNETLLGMFDDLERSEITSHSNLQLLHQHIREFFLEFNPDLCSERKRRALFTTTLLD